MNESYKLPTSKLKMKKIIEEAISLASNVYTDELDCSKSWSRQKTNKTVEEVFKLGLSNKETFWNFFLRDAVGNRESYADVGCRVCGLVDYFLWITLSIDNAEKLIKKYNLKPVKH